MLTQKTFQLKTADRAPKWYVIDASNLVLGRLASEVARILRGKHKPTYTTHIDSGDFVVITNCEKVKLTGDKALTKEYFWHTNHIGGIKRRTAREQFDIHPEKVIFEAVKGMLPKTTLGRKQLTKLKVYVGPAHQNEAQKPEIFKVRG